MKNENKRGQALVLGRLMRLNRFTNTTRTFRHRF